MNTHNQKHLTVSDRLYIEQELLQGTSFKTIAQVLHKNPTTISKEIKHARTLIPRDRFVRKCRLCHFYSSCSSKNLCHKIKEHPYFNTCNASCKKCYRWNPQDECPDFLAFTCNKYTKAPYVCNACPKERTCFLEHYIYNAKKAHRLYEQTLSKSREGINMTPEELQELNDLVSPLILKGQPLSHIFAVHADEIPVCRRTLYNYLDQRVFQARNIDLPRRVRYKKHKKKSEPRKIYLFHRHIMKVSEENTHKKCRAILANGTKKPL